MTSYFAKHWRGQFPLPQSYWLNGVLFLLPLAVWLDLAGGYLAAHPPVLAVPFLLVFIVPFVALLALSVWSGVGIWRSAGRRIPFGRPFWAWLARGVVLLNLAVLALVLIAVITLTRNLLLAAPVQDATGPYEVTLRGNTAVFHGEIGEASAGDLELLLRDKSVKRLAIAGSNGGDVRAALRLARLIHDRKLFVVALAQCDAACTLLLAAGSVRAVVPETIMGFRREAQDADRLYARARLTAPFLDKLHAAPAAKLYEPTLRSLIGCGFLTDIFVDAKKLYMHAPLWCARNAAACNRTGRQNMKVQNAPGGQEHGT